MSADVETDAVEADVTQLPDGLAEIKGVNIAGTIEYVASRFLSEKHFAKIHQQLSKKWDRLQSLTAAIKLMEKYGVHITKEDEERLASLDEDRQIEALVMKMPQQSKNEFQQFFLQLQVLVSTATKVRQALEAGRPGEVEQILNDADASVLPYVLRMAMVQAGSEVDCLKKNVSAWGKDMSRRLGPKIRGQEEKMRVEKQLAQAQAQLAVFTSSQNEKSKKVVMNFLNSSSEGLKAASFKGWHGAVQLQKKENDCAGEFKQRLEAVQAQLMDLKTKSLQGVRNAMEGQARQMASVLVAETLQIWKTEVFEWRRDKEAQAQLEALQKSLSSAQESQKAKAKSMMARMNGDSDTGLKAMVWSAWVTHHEDYAKDRVLEDAVKAKERLIQEHIKAKGDQAKKLLTSSLGGTDSGLIQMAWKGWVEVVQDAQEEARMAEILNGAESKFKHFGQMGKLSGKSALEKQTYYLEMLVITRCWSAWKLDTRMEKMMRGYHVKIDAKRKQLMGVQDMFRTFANQLEGDIKKAGQESTRGEAFLKRRGGLHKSESVTNLPDIHQKKSQMTASGHNYNPNSRHPFEGSQHGSDRSKRSMAGVDKGSAYPAH
jgi:hypothetical protein